MLKRPLLFAATALIVAVFVLMHFFPEAFIPEIKLQDQAMILLTGAVEKIEERAASIYVYLDEALLETEEQMKSTGRAIVIYEKDSADLRSIRIGMRIKCKCIYKAFHEARNFGNFDERSYYYSLGVFIKVKAVSTWITDSSADLFRQFLNDIREQMKKNIYSEVEDEKTAGVIAAICTGDRSGLTDETRNMYQNSGIAHILAVSGLHITLIGMTIFKLLRKKFTFFISAATSSFLMFSFCILSSSSPSAVRATILFMIRLLSIGTGKSYDSLSALSLAAILMTLSEPLIITNSAFIMSFAASLGAGVLYNNLSAFMKIKKSEPEEYRNKRQRQAEKYIQRLGSGLILSLSISITVLPVTSSLYYEIPLYSVLLNIIVIPLMSIVLGAGLLSSVIGIINIMVGRFFSGAGVYVVRFIEWSCRLTEGLPSGRIITGCPSVERIITFYILLTAGIWLISRRLRFRKVSTDRYKKQCLWKKAVLLVAFLAILVAVLFADGGNSCLEISFIDVGQGDCVLIRSPSGQNYMIDGGSVSVESVAKYNISSAVKYKGISVIDYSIVTHPDTDHISGILEIIQGMSQSSGHERMQNGNKEEYHEDFGISIKNLVIPYVEGNEHFDSLISTAREKGINIIYIHAGMELDDGEIVLKCLYPQEGFRSEDVNDYSCVLDLRFGDFSALLTGDLGIKGEEILMKQTEQYAGSFLLNSDYDLLKVSHHGSRYSSSEQFLEKVSPNIAVISAGTNNIYGHPHAETIKRLEQYQSEIYCTIDRGEIIIKADRSGMTDIKTKLGS